MEKTPKFKLSHVVLYAKGWYKATDNVFEDLIKILELDDYTPFDRSDVYNILVQAVQNSGIYRWTELREVLDGIRPSNCWKFGYYTHENKDWAGKDAKIRDYDMEEAFIYYVLSNLRHLPTENWNPCVPKLTKYPKSDNITIRKVYEHFVKDKPKQETKKESLFDEVNKFFTRNGYEKVFLGSMKSNK